MDLYDGYTIDVWNQTTKRLKLLIDTPVLISAIKVRPQLCFFKDFDSFKVELEYLEIVYESKPFRFAYPPNGQNRNFFVKTVSKIQLSLPEMVLQSTNTNDTCFGSHAVDFRAQFEDLGILSDFVAKLKTVANYEQSKIPLVPTCKTETDSEDDIDESDHETDIVNMVPPVRLFFDSEYTAMNVTAQHFEITFQGVVYRFSHRQGNQAREYTAKMLQRAKTPRKWEHLLVKDVRLQERNPLTGHYLDGQEVDFYMIFEDGGRKAELIHDLHNVGYVEV